MIILELKVIMKMTNKFCIKCGKLLFNTICTNLACENYPDPKKKGTVEIIRVEV